jgi:hypothetical protein
MKTATLTIARALVPPLPGYREEPWAAVPAVVSRAAAPSIAPMVRARRRAQRYRGTRLLSFVLLGFAGLGILAVGTLTSQLVAPLDPTRLTDADRVVLPVLVRVAPFAMLFGAAQVLSAVAVLLDRPRAIATGMAAAVVGAAASAAALGLVLVAGVPGVAADIASTGPSGDLAAVFAWAAGLDILAFLAIRRIARGRATA